MLRGRFARSVRSMKEVLRFVAVGLANTVLTYAVYLAALQLMDFRLAYLCALLAGVVFISLGNIRYVFGQSVSWRRVVFYGIYYLAYFGINFFLIHIAVVSFSVPPALAPIAVMAITFVGHFVMSKWILVRATG